MLGMWKRLILHIYINEKTLLYTHVDGSAAIIIFEEMVNISYHPNVPKIESLEYGSPIKLKK